MIKVASFRYWRCWISFYFHRKAEMELHELFDPSNNTKQV